MIQTIKQCVMLYAEVRSRGGVSLMQTKVDNWERLRKQVLFGGYPVWTTPSIKDPMACLSLWMQHF